MVSGQRRVAAGAQDDLDRLIEVLSLPPDTWSRTVSSMRTLITAPLAGKALADPFAPARWILGPWPWMVLVYLYDEGADTVTVVAVQDGRSSGAASHHPA